jgi:phospholipid/cholesterol/gamma-HCH transport system ATP-binding protein
VSGGASDRTRGDRTAAVAEDPEVGVIDVRGVTKSFDGRPVLQGLDLHVERGENFVVMGLSGSGKSVTLKIIAGLIQPDAGSVRVSGVDVVGASREDLSRARSTLGFLFQGAALIKWMSVVENVALPLLEAGVPPEEAYERARHRLADVGLEGDADKSPDKLSGGQRKRVGFARATVNEPKVILYDEPTTGLDPITKQTIDELIMKGRDQLGATGVIVSHDLRSAVRVADRIGLLKDGRLAVVDEPQRFLESDDEMVRKFVEDGASVQQGRDRR